MSTWIERDYDGEQIERLLILSPTACPVSRDFWHDLSQASGWSLRLMREDESYERIRTIAALVGTPAMTLRWLERDLPIDVIARGLAAKLGLVAAAKAHAAGRL